MEAVLLAALRSFYFSNYGCDEIDEFMGDDDLELSGDLAAHILSTLRYHKKYILENL